MGAQATPPGTTVSLLSFDWDKADWSLSVTGSFWFLLGVVVVLLSVLAFRWWWLGRSWTTFEIDQAEIGIGDSKVSFRPNFADRQVGYAIWVELSTRKIGLEIDFEHDWSALSKVVRVQS